MDNDGYGDGMDNGGDVISRDMVNTDMVMKWTMT